MSFATKAGFVALCAALIVVSARAAPGELPVNLERRIVFFLERLSEPKMPQLCDSHVAMYRVLEIQPSRYVTAIRISRTDERIYAVASRSTLSDDSTRSESPLTEEDWGELSALIVSSGFWSMRSEWDVWMPDGTEIYVEGCLEGRYHAAKREHWDADIADLLAYFARFRGAE